MDVLDSLNPAQREAVEAIKGPLLILAGPGSGKTRVITHRVAYLIKTCGITPYHIMAVTFTNKAAREMMERLNHLIGSTALGDLTIGTFHAICARILRREGKAIGIDQHFTIYDGDDQLSLIKRALQELNLDPKQHTPQAIASAISAAKSSLLTPGDYIQHSRSYFEEIIGRVYERYQQSLAEGSGLDFDDLLMKTVQLFKSHPEILSRYQTRYRHLLVDEFQDTNLVQYELIKQIGGKYRNICVVGDPDQSIYSWRFADLRNILNFEKDYPETKLVLLEQNYRSTRLILEAASTMIVANQQRKPKDLWTENDQGEPVTVVETYTEQEEAQFVINEIERLVGQGKTRLGDCAVMYRTNAQSRVLEEAFIRYGTPYKIVAGTRFYERREVKDIIAYLRFIQNPSDSVSLMRIINIPQRGIGDQTQAKIASWARSQNISLCEAMKLMAAETTEPAPLTAHVSKILSRFLSLMDELITVGKKVSLVELFDLVLERTDYKHYLSVGMGGDERWENILELRTVAQQYNEMKPPEGLVAFLEGVTLVSDVDGLDETKDTVTLLTLHQAKGLEFPVVLIVGMEEGLLPHFKSFDDPGQMEEERRLCYVGITRAKKKVYLIRAFRRSFMGHNGVTEPSRFLKDIPHSSIASRGYWQGEDKPVAEAIYSWNKPTAPSADSPANTPILVLKAGDHVQHPHFGNGIVVSYKPVKDDAEVAIAFNTGVKKFLVSLANLEKVA